MAPEEADGWRWEADPRFPREVFDSLGAGLIVVDRGGRIVAVNPNAEATLGRSAAAMAGADFHDLLHRAPDGAVAARARCPLLAVVDEGRPAWGSGDSFLRGDGRLIPVNWSGAPVLRNGEALGAAVLFADATISRAALAEQGAYLAELTDLNERLTLVGQITAAMSQTLDVPEALGRLARLVVPRLAEWAAIDLRIGDDEARRVAVIGPEGRDAEQEAWRGALPRVAQHSHSALVRVLRGGPAALLDPDEIAAPPDSPLAAVHAGFLHAVNATSAITVPLGTGQPVMGALTLVRADPDRPFGAVELDLAVDIGRRAGLAIDNARRYTQQRDIAETMQRHLLPTLPAVGPLRMAARYRPAPPGSQVGGDWYDAFALPDGATALVIGDVVGHNLTAAAGMAQLRNILRSLAWDRAEPPGAVVDRLDQAMPHLTDVPMATLILARVEREAPGGWRLRWTSAGHPPPLLIRSDGHAEFLEEGQDLLLSADLPEQRRRRDASVPLPPESTLLLYTDGLVERPGADLETGLSRLRRHAAELAKHSLEEFLTRILEPMASHSTDDIALLALRVPGSSRR